MLEIAARVACQEIVPMHITSISTATSTPMDCLSSSQELHACMEYMIDLCNQLIDGEGSDHFLLAGYGCGTDRDVTQHAKRRCCSPSVATADTLATTSETEASKPVLPLYARRAASGRAASISPTAISI